ncbi:MAG: glucosamine-6-phosphate deaminase [Clostridia bacterium]|nr:glucosamine-6-phosphate deaminase [Clostridia bacterium]MBR2296787.1 glucosamine-6-phosphate deaminase [Clostridia bacterium]
MNFIRVNTYEELSTRASAIICGQVAIKPNCVLGLATGSSPLGAYAKIIEKNKASEVDFSNVKSINLDEYVGLDGDHDQSYRYFMNNNLFKHINIDISNTYVPNGCASDIDAECRAYDELIASLGGIDLQLLGIGYDGHIGFNEPDTYFEKATHKVTLDDSTIEANSRFFATRDDVPKTAITMGMGGIMSAKKVLLIANGKGKRDIIERAFFGPITPEVPASILQLHPDLTVIYSEN